MRNIRKLIACALVAVIVIGALAACGEIPQAPESTSQEDGEKTEDDSSDLYTYDAQLPIIDGSISAEALADAFYGSLDREGAAGLRVSFSGTERALERLSEGEIDAALIAADSKLASSIASGERGDLKIFELARDAVVFAVSKNNMVDGVSSEQVRDIYSGEISSWKDAGGAEVQIKAYQRPAGSELRALMEAVVMDGEEALDEQLRPRYSEEEGVYYEQSGYDAAPAAMGYAFWFQAAPGYESSKLLSVDEVAPSPETIASGEYPFSFGYYLVVKSDDLGFAGADLLAAYMQGPFVQDLIAGSGYVNLKGTPAADDAKPSPDQPEEGSEQAENQTPYSNNSSKSSLLSYAAAASIEFKTEYQGGKKSSPNRYVSISGLADAEVQEKINARIEELSDEYTAGTSLPSYRGLDASVEQFEESFEKSSSIELSFAAGDIVSFRAERTAEIDGLTIREISGLSFDLRTGEELSIGDLFGSGFDVSAAVDSAVRRYIRENMLDSADPASSENLIRPFGGINADQPFYLSDEGLNVVIDGSNEEFDLGSETEFSPIVITVGYDLLDGSFIGARDSNPSIYEEPESIPYLFKGNSYGSVTELIEHYNGSDERISFSSVYTYPAGFPKKLLGRIREDVLAALPNAAYYEEVLASGMSELDSLSFFAVSECSQVGGYYCVRQRLITQDADTGEFSERTVLSLYDSELEPAELSALFSEGSDWESVVLKALSSAFKKDITDELLYTYNGEKAADLMEGLGFVLSPDGIDLMTSPFEVAKRGKKGSSMTQLSFSLKYADFGEGSMAFAPVGGQDVSEQSGEI